MHAGSYLHLLLCFKHDGTRPSYWLYDCCFRHIRHSLILQQDFATQKIDFEFWQIWFWDKGNEEFLFVTLCKQTFRKSFLWTLGETCNNKLINPVFTDGVFPAGLDDLGRGQGGRWEGEGFGEGGLLHLTLLPGFPPTRLFPSLHLPKNWRPLWKRRIWQAGKLWQILCIQIFLMYINFFEWS